jgi:glucosamine-6-phosphate deaminase
MSAVAAEIVAGEVREKPEAVFLLPTGTTPLGMYRRLTSVRGESFLGAITAEKR